MSHAYFKTHAILTEAVFRHHAATSLDSAGCTLISRHMRYQLRVCSSSRSNNFSVGKWHTHSKTHAILTESVFFLTQQQFQFQQVAHSSQLTCDINSWSVSSPLSFCKSHTHFKIHAILTEGVLFITQQLFKFQQVAHSFQLTCDIN